MNIIYSDICDDNFINNLLKKGFDCGKKYGSNENIFDDASLYNLFNDYNIEEKDEK
jgi:hypothetical protein